MESPIAEREVRLFPLLLIQPGQPPPPTRNTTSDSNPNAYTITTIPFKLNNIEYPYENNFCIVHLFPQSLILEGEKVEVITITGKKAQQTWQVGDTIYLTDIQFENHEKATIEEGELFMTSKMFGEVKINSTSPLPNSPSNPTSQPSHYPEVQQKNQELNREGDNFDLLVEELLKIIEKNQKICQAAQNHGLNLPKLPADTLEFFETDSFQLLDDTQPLSSSHNSQINTENEQIRQKKLNIKKNIYRIYENNQKKLAEAKTGKTPPKNELEKLKEEVKGKINKVLTDKDNLRNINLTTLENGKYQNWEKDIEQLTSSGQLITYVEAFLKVLRATGAKEKEKEQTKKSPPLITPPNSLRNKEDNVIDDNTKKAINNLPLAAAKNLAKSKIRELFNKYNPKLQTLKKLWGGEKNWMSYLEKCNNPEEIMTFLKKLEQEIIQQSLSQGWENNNQPKNSIPFTKILPFLIIGLFFLISLVIIVKLHYKRKK